jgi:hypothetical protein
MQDERQLRQGDGLVTLLPNENALLFFRCRDCGRDSSVVFAGISRPTPIDCDDERLCIDCEKKSLVRLHKDAGSTIPEEDLLAMTRDELLSLRSRDSE